MTLIESVRRYVAEYPGLKGGTPGVDFLPDAAESYSVDAVPARTLVRQYLDGSRTCRFLFVLASRAHYGPELRGQIDNCRFFEEFETWITRRDRAREYPELGEGREALRLEVTSSGYALAPGADTARYQIQCKLTYHERGGDFNETVGADAGAEPPSGL